jgi:hypothetical protein
MNATAGNAANRLLRLTEVSSHRRLVVLLGAAVLMTVTLTACTVPRHPGTHPLSAAAPTSGTAFAPLPAGGTFLSVTNPPATTVRALQLRSAADGTLVRPLLTGAFDVFGSSVSRSIDGTVLLAERPSTCITRIERLDIATGHVTVTRTIDEYAADVVFDPTGHRLAYQSYASCTVARDETGCDGCAESSANVTTVIDLDTGATSRVSQPLGLAAGLLGFSPDGSRLLVDSGGLVLLDPADVTAKGSHVAAPRGCAYDAGTWTTDGILADESCGTGNRLVRVNPTGQIEQSWPIPACGGIYGFGAGPDGSTMANITIGYGNGTCAHVAYQVWEISGAATRVVISGDMAGGLGWYLAGP